MNSVTDKYKGAIESFSADLQLAKSGLKELKELDKLLADNNERLLKDIDLLDELDFNLRYGNIMLVEAELFIRELIKRIAKVIVDSKENKND